MHGTHVFSSAQDRTRIGLGLGLFSAAGRRFTACAEFIQATLLTTLSLRGSKQAFKQERGSPSH